MNELEREQAKLNKLAEKNRGRVAVILEGRDTAGKTGTIRTVTQYLNPLWFSVCLSCKPSESEMNHWLGSWKRKMPAQNQIVFYDRSWYSRSLCQRLNGWCSDRQVDNFLERVENWENRIENNGTAILKFWLSISADTQKERLTRRIGCPLRGWKFSANDANALKTYDQMTDYKNDTFNWSSNWNEVDFNDKEIGQKEMLKTILYTLRELRDA